MLWNFLFNYYEMKLNVYIFFSKATQLKHSQNSLIYTILKAQDINMCLIHYYASYISSTRHCEQPNVSV